MAYSNHMYIYSKVTLLYLFYTVGMRRQVRVVNWVNGSKEWAA
jgi:hypothetical protein